MTDSKPDAIPFLAYMKMTLLVLTALLIILSARSQMIIGSVRTGGPIFHMGYQSDWTGGEFLPQGAPRPRDPLRIIGDDVWKVAGRDTNGWVIFNGKVLEVQSTGIRIRGFFSGYPSNGDGTDFFIENFPYVVAEDEYLGFDDKSKTFYCAKTAGTYTYTTVMGGSRTIRKLDYGQIYVPPAPAPLTKEQLAELKASEDKRKKEGEAKTVKWLRDQADAGDAYSQLRMGERYLKGDGVEKDKTKARTFLQKSSAQGNKDASELLNSLGDK